MKRGPTQQTLEREVAKWNAAVPIGTKVEYRDYPGAAAQTFATRTAAEILGGHSAVVWLDGKSGCVHISHCKPCPQPPYPEFCRHPDQCAGKGYCPRDPTCAD